MKILDIGCGMKKFEGEKGDVVVGLDIHKLPSVDVVHDLEKTPLPFGDNIFDMIYTSHTLEHIKDILPLIREIYRILKHKGILKVVVPHFSNPYAYQPEHKTYWSYSALDTFKGVSVESYYGKTNFNINSVEFRLFIPKLSWIANRFPNFYEAWLSGFLKCAEITYVLEAIK